MEVETEASGEIDSQPEMSFGGDGTVDFGISLFVPQEDLEVWYPS